MQSLAHSRHLIVVKEQKGKSINEQMDEWTREQGRGTVGQEWMKTAFPKLGPGPVPMQQPGDVRPQNNSLGLSFRNCKMGMIVIPTSFNCSED